MTARIAELASTKLDMRLGVGKELNKLPDLLLDVEQVLTTREAPHGELADEDL